MDCTVCGTTNDAGRKFCIECGAALVLTCPACGTANPPHGKFCGECGTALSAGGAASSEATPATPASGATERRLVSVLFLDLVSFTSLSEQRDAEDMRSVMDRYFETARTVIERHGGVVEKFIGDAVMAVWGTPVAHEDDAERAVRTGLELVGSVEGLGTELGLPLRVRAGVLTGEAATSSAAGNQGMVTGDMVNTASRLQSAAEPGTVLVGEGTSRAASRSVVFAEVGELPLKGKEEPVRAWRALRVVSERSGSGRLVIEPPFVGRGEELRLLKEMLHATGREGKSRVVSVSGIGGIGKSRLAWELLKYIDGLEETVWWHRGRCPSYGDGITFWALGEMVRMRARIAETDPPSASLAKLAASIAEHVPDEDERRWIEPRLGFLLGLGERPAGGREELFAAWRAFFERLSDVSTVAMVFEDLQWADAGLLDFIESLLEWSRNKPIFVLTLARPELADRRPDWGVGQRSFVSLHLDPLSDEAMAELVRGMVPDADDEAVARIADRSEGVPLYAVETIRMLADRGVLRLGTDAYESVGDLGDFRIPETLHALIASRLDALGEDDRALLQDAAVLGKSFTLDALAAVTGQDAASLEPRLRDLTKKEFLAFEADARSPERGQYAFVQGLIQEVASGMLSKADRRSRHLAAAHHFESVADDEIAGVVAAHYVEALGATPDGPDADALAARARDWLGQAAERAAALGSPVQALTFLEQALAITPAGRERADLLRQAALAASDALRREDRIAFLREAVDVLRPLGDVDAEVVAMGALAVAYADFDDAESLRPLAERMRERLGTSDDLLARASLDRAEAALAYYATDYEGGVRSIDRALAGFERAGAADEFRQLIGWKSGMLAWVGRRTESMLLLRGRLAIANEENDLRTISQALMQLGTAAPENADALAFALESAAAARRGGYGEREIGALANGVEAAIESGAWTTADEILEDLRTRSALPEAIVDLVTINDALLSAYRGDERHAREELDGVADRMLSSADHQIRAWFRRVRSVRYLMGGAVSEAFDEAIGAVEEDPEGINMPLAGWCAGRAASWLRDAEKLRSVLGRTAAAREVWFAAARRSFEAGVAALDGRERDGTSTYRAVLAERASKGDRFGHALITLDAIAILPPELVPEDASASARAYLEELGAEPLLARCTRVDAPR